MSDSKKDNKKKIKSDGTSGWKEAAKYRRENRWLEYSSQIARRILAVIHDHPDLNQVKLAATLNVSPQRINTIVKGKENLTLETIYKLSRALDTELIQFPPYRYGQQQVLTASFYAAIATHTVSASSLTMIAGVVQVGSLGKNQPIDIGEMAHALISKQAEGPMIFSIGNTIQDVPVQLG